MKFRLIFLLTILYSLNLFSQSNNRIVELSGPILDKYPIKMTLTIRGREVLGCYYYEKHKVNILLVGELKDNKLTLKESPDYESDFKIGFMGIFKDNKFIGDWIDKNNGKSLKFEASVISDNPMVITSQISKIIGTYDNIYNSDKYSSTVDLQYITDDLFCFEISNGTESGCVGFVKGLVKLTNLKNGLYTGDLCKELKFSLSSNDLTITEINCELHGMRCPFDGKYRKK